MSLLIRADAASKTGSGHVMRCLALALWAKMYAIPVLMTGNITIPWVRERLKLEKIPFVENDYNKKASVISKDILKNIPQDGWIVFDGYHFDLQAQEFIRELGYKLLVIDDYAHLEQYSCDILLNQNIGATLLNYRGSIGKMLLEPEYALLRPEFVRNKFNTHQHQNLNLLISLGGGDPGPYLDRVTSELSPDILKGCHIHLLAGNMNDAVITDHFSRLTPNFSILHNVFDMASLISEMDLCITAGGSTCWELCCLGVPFLIFSIAQNQDNIVSELIKRTYSTPYNKTNLQTLIESANLRKQCKLKIQSLVSGYGAKYVLSNMFPEHVHA